MKSLALNIPVAGLVDSNENPLNYTFPIPGNSKSLNSVYFFYMFVFRLVKFANLETQELFIKSLKRLNILIIISERFVIICLN